MNHKMLRAAIAGTGLAMLPGVAAAQYAQFLQTDTALIKQAIPEGFDRGRNVAVTEQARPDYDATGVPLSSFNVYPRLDLGVGATNNVFLTQNDRKSDGVATIQPTVRAASDWSRHRLELDGGADIERYFSQTRRNQASWSLGGKGAVELGDSLEILPEADVSRQYESPYSGDVQSDVSALSNYLTSFLSLRGQYQAGRVRGQLAVDRTSFDFSNIDFGNGDRQSQDYRNRDVVRVSGQGEYAFSPSLSAYVQVNRDHISYDTTLLNGLPNRTSDGVRVLAGVNFDLAGFLRGSLGAGYVHRDYTSSLYKSVNGPAVEAELDYFPTELTTVTLKARRFLEDSGIGSNQAYFDSRLSLRVDHALLDNLLVNVGGDYGRTKYIGLADKRSFYRVFGGATYLATRRYGLRANLSYGRQSSDGTSDLSQFQETRGQIGLYLQI